MKAPVSGFSDLYFPMFQEHRDLKTRNTSWSRISVGDKPTVQVNKYDCLFCSIQHLEPIKRNKNSCTCITKWDWEIMRTAPNMRHPDLFRTPWDCHICHWPLKPPQCRYAILVHGVSGYTAGTMRLFLAPGAISRAWRSGAPTACRAPGSWDVRGCTMAYPRIPTSINSIVFKDFTTPGQPCCWWSWKPRVTMSMCFVIKIVRTDGKVCPGPVLALSSTWSSRAKAPFHLVGHLSQNGIWHVPV